MDIRLTDSWTESRALVENKLESHEDMLIGTQGVVRKAERWDAQLSLIVKLLVGGITLGASIAAIFGVWFAHIDAMTRR
jgi:hypothetical protein